MVSVTFDDSDNAGERAGSDSFSLAHISDPHISCVADIRFEELLGKRFFGYLKWRLHRSAEHSDRVLSALHEDLARTQPHHIVVTGDLTHLSLPSEFRHSRQWLESLGSPANVTVIPGNHDTYVKTDWQQTLAHWTDYMLADEAAGVEHPPSGFDVIFPSLRVRGRIALIGVCTALPTAPHLAVGILGDRQLEKLEKLLAETAARDLFRVLLIHHPPVPGSVSWRKRLTDAPALETLLARCGSELVLHGHNHKTGLGRLKTPDGHAAVIGLPSASALGRTLQRQARYVIYHITPRASGWHVRLAVRIYSLAENRFIAEPQHPFSSMP